MGKNKNSVKKRKHNTRPKIKYEIVAWRCMNCFEIIYIGNDDTSIPYSFSTCDCRKSSCTFANKNNYLMTGQAEPLYTKLIC